MVISTKVPLRLLWLTYLAVTVAGCASQGTSVARGERVDATPAGSVAAHEEIPTGDRVADIALTMVGKPYQFGGSSPSGFDCSGLVYYAYGRLGVPVPRTSREQRKAARNVGVSSVRRGDLLFFDTSWKSGHVGIYVGDGRFVHAPSSGKRVSIEPLTEGYFASRLEAAGRLHY